MARVSSKPWDQGLGEERDPNHKARRALRLGQGVKGAKGLGPRPLEID